jgi:DNA-binding response OmpR family regulator
MLPRTARILCVDSSDLRLSMLTRTLEKSGFEVWTARGASDAVCLASGLHFEAVVVDRLSSLQRAEIWECLTEAHPQLPVLVHEGTSRAVELCGGSGREGLRTINPEVVLGLLMLLLGEDREAIAFSPTATAA